MKIIFILKRMSTMKVVFAWCADNPPWPGGPQHPGGSQQELQNLRLRTLSQPAGPGRRDVRAEEQGRSAHQVMEKRIIETYSKESSLSSWIYYYTIKPRHGDKIWTLCKFRQVYSTVTWGMKIICLASRACTQKRSHCQILLTSSGEPFYKMIKS